MSLTLLGIESTRVRMPVLAAVSLPWAFKFSLTVDELCVSAIK